MQNELQDFEIIKLLGIPIKIMEAIIILHSVSVYKK
jgi:hypothetical protein